MVKIKGFKSDLNNMQEYAKQVWKNKYNKA